MSEHVTAPQMKRFGVSALPQGELVAVATHVSVCKTCQGLLSETLRSQSGTERVSFTLAPEFWLRHEHVDSEQLINVADNKLDATDREILDIHLSICATCREEVRSFLAFREQIAHELNVSYAPPVPRQAHEKLTWWNAWLGLTRNPIYAAAVFVIGIALVVGAVLLLKRRAENFQAKQGQTPQVSPTPTPDSRAADIPSPPATPSESPIDKPINTETVAALNDRGGSITVDKSGNVTGLDDVPAPIREEVARVLLSEKLERPPILKELSGQNSTLRGVKNTQPFTLLYPSRTVIVTDRPTFKWAKASGAGSYQVYVNDPAGREIAKSEDLSSKPTEWTPTTRLKRGETYIWTVVAIVDGKEIVSPGPASPEVRFQILSRKMFLRMNQLKKARSHLALAVFYAEVGLLVEAQVELQELVRLNPESKIARNLLNSLRVVD